MTAPLLERPPQLRGLLDGASWFLEQVYDHDAALYPYSTQLVQGAFVNDYVHPQTHRYTINSLLGVAEAARAGVSETPPLDEVEARVARFLELHGARLTSPADLGLLLVLLAATDAGEAARTDALRRVGAAVPRAGQLAMQDLAWMLWGAVASARAGVREAEGLAERIYQTIAADFVDPRSGMPRHTLNPLRRHVVSFGGIVYFLRALAEYAALTGDEGAEQRFRRGVATTVGFQGAQGEWPWMIHVPTGIPFDLYPVFAVHQDAMAMLFLFPALERDIPGVEEAIERSLAWALGSNQLGVRMYQDDPFLAFRSIHRRGRALRARRYLRSLRPRPATPIAAERVMVNPECRSYHLGWMLYAWASRPEARA